MLSGETCALDELTRVASWLAAQSAQQCGPWRFGLPALAADIAALSFGDVAAWPAVHRHAAVIEGRDACTHPTAAVQFVRSALRVLDPEVTTTCAAGADARYWVSFGRWRGAVDSPGATAAAGRLRVVLSGPRVAVDLHNG